MTSPLFSTRSTFKQRLTCVSPQHTELYVLAVPSFLSSSSCTVPLCQVCAEQLVDAAELAAEFASPSLLFSLNHAGFPTREACSSGVWREGIRAVAQAGQAGCGEGGKGNEEESSTVCKIGALGCYDEEGGFGKQESMYVKRTHSRRTTIHIIPRICISRFTHHRVTLPDCCHALTDSSFSSSSPR